MRKSPLGALCLLVIVFAICSQHWDRCWEQAIRSKIDPLAVFASPSREYPMGTDYLGPQCAGAVGRGMRVSLAIALVSRIGGGDRRGDRIDGGVCRWLGR